MCTASLSEVFSLKAISKSSFVSQGHFKCKSQMQDTGEPQRKTVSFSKALLMALHCIITQQIRDVKIVSS